MIENLNYENILKENFLEKSINEENPKEKSLLNYLDSEHFSNINAQTDINSIKVENPNAKIVSKLSIFQV